MPKIVDHDQRRDEIAGVATALIANGGLEAATIRAIAGASGHSKGVVEHYFENKQRIIQAALQWINARYSERASAVTEGHTGLAALRERILTTLPTTREIRDEWKVRLVFYSQAAIDGDLRREQSRRWRSAVAVYEKEIRAAISNGEVSHAIDPEQQARRLLQTTIGISTAALHDTGFYTAKQLRAEVDQLLVPLTNTRVAA